MAEERNDEQNDGYKFQDGNNDKSSGPRENALKRMKTHESVPFIRIEKQKDERWHEREVGKRTGDVSLNTPTLPWARSGARMCRRSSGRRPPRRAFERRTVDKKWTLVHSRCKHAHCECTTPSFLRQSSQTP